MVNDHRMPLPSNTALTEHILDSLPSGIVAIRADWQVIYTNPQAQELLADESGEVDLQKIFEKQLLTQYPSGKPLSRTNSPLGRALDGEHLHHEHLRIASGPIFQGSARPTPDGAIWFLQTDQKNAREKARLTSENDELRHFARSLTHDLKEPLRAVTGFLNLLEKQLDPHLDKSSRQLFDFAQRGAERMKDLIASLSGLPLEQTETAQNVELEQVLGLAVFQLQASISEKQAIILFEPLPKIEGWKEPLTQIFQNLIGNAIKYCDEPKPKIEISSQLEDDHWHLKFQDNGIGISQKDLSNIFLPSVRLSPDRPGTGFGLTICKRAVELHQGRIWAAPRTPGGTTFHVLLPVALSPSLEAISSPPDKPPNTPNIDFEQVLESMHDMILVKGDRSRLLWANKAFRDLYGMSNQELQDLIDSPHSDPDDTVQYVKDDHKVFTEGKPLRITEPVTNHQGETRYFDTMKTAIRDSSGVIVKTVGVSRRIQDSSLIETSAGEREQRKEKLEELRVLVQNIPLAVAMLDVKERVLAQSKAWESLFDYREEEIIGHFYDEICETRLPLLDDLRQSAATGECVERHRINFGSEGRRLNLQIQPWKLSGGEIGGTIVVLSDVTAIVRSEIQLQERNQELSEFNYRLSHDFLAPLRSIQGLSRIARKAALSADRKLGRESSERILEDSSQLIDLLLNLQNFARSEQSAETPETLEIETLVDQIFKLKSALDPSPNLTLRQKLDVSSVRLPALRFHQIVSQLLSNAIKYREPGQETDEIVVSAESKNGVFHFSVSNRGPAIPDEQAASVFKLFHRGSASHRGNGVGLYFVKKQTDALGGSIRYQHHEGITSFKVKLPVGQV